MASLHEELSKSVNLEDGQENLDTVEGFRKDVKKKLSKFLCGVSDLTETTREPGPAPSPSASTSSTDFAQIKTTFVGMETHKAVGGDMDSDVYDFSHPRRGLAIIINNEDFSDTRDFDDRPGSSYDASALYHSFAHLGFDVLTYPNLPAWKMVEVLKAAARDYDHQNADCFACSILTHGDQTWSDREYDRLGVTVRQDLLFGTDGKAVATRTVVDLFSDRASPGLKGKPRLFFLQACRGNKLDEGQDMHVITPIPQGIRSRRGRDVPDATDSTNEPAASTGEASQSSLPAAAPVTTAAGALAQRQISLSSSVDPPGYPKVSQDMVDAKPASDDDDDDEERNENGRGNSGSAGHGGGSQGHFPAPSGGGVSLTDARGGEREDSTVDRSRGGPWKKMRDVPVSPTPLYKDCLVMYATPPGYYAWRREGGGPWFVPCLVTAFTSSRVHSTPLAKVLVQVAGTVAKYFESNYPNSSKFDGRKLMPVIESMLVKDIIFTQKPRN